MSDLKTKAVILAAGKGTRMKSSLPKVLQKIFDKPLLGYVIDALQKNNKIDYSYVIVGHQSELVEKYVESTYENAKCILQEPQKGTGDAVAKACPELQNFKGNVLIICGDTPLVTAESIDGFIDFHNKNNADLTLMTAIFENPYGYGRIVRDKDNSLKSIVEEKDTNEEIKKIKEINAGIYCINWEKLSPAFSELKNNNSQGEYYLTDIIAWAVAKKLKTQAFILDDNDELFGINSKKHLAEATKLLNNRTLDRLMDNGVTIVDPESTFISDDTEIGADTIVYPNTFINGKNKIGKNCKIGPFAHIRDGAIIGDNVRIGNFVEIKKSIIKSNTNVSHLSYIGDSELGNNVNIGAGTITANYNPITKVKSKTIIEDGANTGSNSVIVAPVTLEKNSMIAAGAVITKDVPENTLALTRAPLKLVKGWFKKA